MLNILTVFMFISVCVGVVLFAYIINNGNIHYMKYLATLIACVVIYIFGYMIELHSNDLNNALFWNGIQYIAIPVISTLWLVVVLLYIGIIKKADSWIVLSLFIIPAITYILRWTNGFHFLYYTGYNFNIYGEFGVLELGKGSWYYVQQIYGCIETFLVILIFLIYSYKVSNAERFRYRLLSLVSAAASISILMLLIDPKDLGLDYTAILFPVPLFVVSYLIAKQDFFEISSTARKQIFNQSNEAINTERISHRNNGFELLQGNKHFSGEILGGCIESIFDIFNNGRYEDSIELCQRYGLFPDIKDWRGKILLLESSEEQPNPKAYKDMIMTIKSTGIFDAVNGVLVGKPMDELYYEEYKKILIEVIDNPKLPILYNINIGHATPRCIIPFGVFAEIDAEKQIIRFNKQA